MRHEREGEHPQRGEPRQAPKLPPAGSGGVAPLRIRVEVREGGRPNAASAAGRITGLAGAGAVVYTIELRGDGALLVEEGDLSRPERAGDGPIVRRIVSFN